MMRVLSVCVLVVFLCGCEKKTFDSVFVSRIGNVYENINGNENILVEFKKDKLEIYSNGVRNYKIKYKDASFKGSYVNDSLVTYKVSNFLFGGQNEIKTWVDIGFSVDPVNSTVEFQDKLFISFSGSSVDAIHYFKLI